MAEITIFEDDAFSVSTLTASIKRTKPLAR